MRPLAKFRASHATLSSALLAASFCARQTFAQGTADGTPTTNAPAPSASAADAAAPNTPGPGAPASSAPPVVLPAPAPTPGAAGTAAPPAPPPPPPPVTQALRSFEEMPASAYPSPSPRVRGIYGGSLWQEADMQGLEWPYYTKTGIGFSGYGWVDTGYRTYRAGEPTSAPGSGLGTQASQGKQFVQQSRFLLRTTPTWTDPKTQLFIQMQVELVGAQINTTQNGIVWSADDAWIRLGKWKLFDVLVGRFQAWEVYHYGMGLDLYTLERNGANDDTLGNAPPIYGLTYMYQRQDVLGQGAVHLYPADWLRFEVGFQYGSASNGENAYGVRPVGIAEFGPLRIKAGAEFLESRPQSPGTQAATQSQGVGGSIQLVADPYVECGVNGAYALNDTRSSDGLIDEAATNETFSVGGFANVRIYGDLLFGTGLNYTHLVDKNYDAMVGRNDNYDQWQPFAALQYLLLKQLGSPSPGLFIKAVFAYARADLNPTPMVANSYVNEMFSGRLRLEYFY